MKKITASISSTPDMPSLAEALARPGNDPRVWCTYALITGYGVDPESGVYADIITLPERAVETAMIPAIYGGNGWGAYFPYQINTVVLVVAPEGNPDAGLQIVGVVNSGSNLPPPEAAESPDDIIIRAEEDTSVRVFVSGTAKVHLKVEGSGDLILDVADGVVRLGSDTSSESVVLGDAFNTWLQTQLSVSTAFGPSGPSLVPLGSTELSTKVKAE